MESNINIGTTNSHQWEVSSQVLHHRHDYQNQPLECNNNCNVSSSHKHKRTKVNDSPLKSFDYDTSSNNMNPKQQRQRRKRELNVVVGNDHKKNSMIPLLHLDMELIHNNDNDSSNNNYHADDTNPTDTHVNGNGNDIHPSSSPSQTKGFDTTGTSAGNTKVESVHGSTNTIATCCSNNCSDNIFRQEGISIGYHYLRIDGCTIHRNQFYMDHHHTTGSSTDTDTCRHDDNDCDLYTTTRPTTKYNNHSSQLQNLIQIHNILGHGAFSTVYRGTWRRKHQQNCNSNHNDTTTNIHDTDHDSLVVEVAIKVWTMQDVLFSQQRLNMLLKELRTLSLVSLTTTSSNNSSSSSCNKNITSSLVQLYGAYMNHDCDDDHTHHPSISLVLEYMNRGSLQQFVQQYGSHNHCQNTNRNSTCCNVNTTISNNKNNYYNGLSESIIAAILYQILCGLHVLHDQYHIIHRDLKPDNILFNSSGYVKLCDFGISSIGSSVSNPSTNSSSSSSSMDTSTVLNQTVLGTTKYMSPERLRVQTYSRSSDIWSFGCIIFYCCTKTILYNTIHSIIDLIITMEEMTSTDLLQQLHTTRFDIKQLQCGDNIKCHQNNNTCRTNDNNNSNVNVINKEEEEEEDDEQQQQQEISKGLQEIFIGCMQLEPAKRIPTKVLLQSPWFSDVQNIHTHQDAIQRLYDYYEQNNRNRT